MSLSTRPVLFLLFSFVPRSTSNMAVKIRNVAFAFCFFFTVPLICQIFATAEDRNYSLELVQVLYRHGDRTPIDPYPTDPWKDQWPEGYGQLTKLGMQQQYQLGKYLRRRYGDFLNSTYRSDMIVVRSSDMDRTLMSAYCNLAGLFPPTNSEEWNAHLKWQPISVHTRPADIDWALILEAPCPRYNLIKAELMKSKEMQAINSKYQKLYEYLSDVTGRLVKDIFHVGYIYDVLLIEKIHNMTLPEWADPIIMEQLKTIQDLKCLWAYHTTEQRRLKGGPLLGEMLTNIENKMTGQLPNMQMYMYSAHDTTVAAFLENLKIYNGISPPYFAMVMVELHRINCSHFVRILYRNSTTEEPYELSINKCDVFCPWETFKKLTRDLFPKDVERECRITSPVDANLLTVVIATVFVCALLVLLISAVVYYKRVLSTYRYLNVQDDQM